MPNRRCRDDGGVGEIAERAASRGRPFLQLSHEVPLLNSVTDGKSSSLTDQSLSPSPTDQSRGPSPKLSHGREGHLPISVSGQRRIWLQRGWISWAARSRHGPPRSPTGRDGGPCGQPLSSRSRASIIRCQSVRSRPGQSGAPTRPTTDSRGGGGSQVRPVARRTMCAPSARATGAQGTLTEIRPRQGQGWVYFCRRRRPGRLRDGSSRRRPEIVAARCVWRQERDAARAVPSRGPHLATTDEGRALHPTPPHRPDPLPPAVNSCVRQTTPGQ